MTDTDTPPPLDETNGDIDHVDDPQGEPEAPPEPIKLVSYAVYELPDHNEQAVAPGTMTDSQWTIATNVTAKDGQSGEAVVLLPIALRSLSGAQATFEYVEQVVDRR